MMITGKRHDFVTEYEVGFDDDGRILGVDFVLARPLRLFRPTCRLDQRPRDAPLATTAISSRTSGSSVVPLQDQHGVEHGVPRLRQSAGHDRHRAGDRRHRASSRQGSSGDTAARNFYGVHDRNVTHYKQTIVDNDRRRSSPTRKRAPTTMRAGAKSARSTRRARSSSAASR